MEEDLYKVEDKEDLYGVEDKRNVRVKMSTQDLQDKQD